MFSSPHTVAMSRGSTARNSQILLSRNSGNSSTVYTIIKIPYNCVTSTCGKKHEYVSPSGYARSKHRKPPWFNLPGKFNNVFDMYQTGDCNFEWQTKIQPTTGWRRQILPTQWCSCTSVLYWDRQSSHWTLLPPMWSAEICTVVKRYRVQ